MSAILLSLGTQVAKEAGKFLLDQYGDDALRLFQQTVQARANAKQVSDEAAQATQLGLVALLAELNRPYEEFFGPRIGSTAPTAPAPSSGVVSPYLRTYGSDPRLLPEAALYQPGDEVWERNDIALWGVTQKGVGGGIDRTKWTSRGTF